MTTGKVEREAEWHVALKIPMNVLMASVSRPYMDLLVERAIKQANKEQGPLLDQVADLRAKVRELEDAKKPSGEPANLEVGHKRYAVTFGRFGIREAYVSVWAYTEDIARAWAHKEYGACWSGIYEWSEHIADAVELFPKGELGVTVLMYEDARLI